MKTLLPIMSEVDMPLRAGREAPIKLYPFAELQPGQMFFAPDKRRKTLTPYASTMGRRLGYKFATRDLYMIATEDGSWAPTTETMPGAVLGVGVWRIS